MTNQKQGVGHYQGYRVYTGGTFDLFHSGHVNLLRQCRKIAGPGGRVIVSLNTDEFINEFKGKPPIIRYKGRSEVLYACKYVDEVRANSGGADSRPSIELAKVDFIVIGDDWCSKDYYAQMGFTQKWLDDRGITLIYVPYTQGISTTEIKERLK